MAFATGNDTASSAGDDSAAGEDTSEPPEESGESVCGLKPDEPGVVPVGEWYVDEGGDVALMVTTVDRDDLSYRLDFSLKFDGETVIWSEELSGPLVATTEDVPVVLPSIASLSLAQAEYYSQLRVRVVALDGDAREVYRDSAETLRVKLGEGGQIAETLTEAELADAGGLGGDGQLRESAPALEMPDGTSFVVTDMRPPR